MTVRVAAGLLTVSSDHIMMRSQRAQCCSDAQLPGYRNQWNAGTQHPGSCEICWQSAGCARAGRGESNNLAGAPAFSLEAETEHSWPGNILFLFLSVCGWRVSLALQRATDSRTHKCVCSSARHTSSAGPARAAMWGSIMRAALPERGLLL